MVKATLRDLFAHKGRVAMTIVAIMLGVTATVASWIVSDSIATTLVHNDTRTDVGVSVQSTRTDNLLTTADRDRLAALNGVRHASGVLVGRAGLVGGNGKLVTSATLPEQAGTDWDGSGRFHLAAGSAPAHAGEVAVNKTDADAAGIKVGDQTRVLLAGGKQDTPVVSGIFTYRTLGPQSSSDGASDPVPVVAYDAATASSLLGDNYQRVELAAAAGVDPGTLKTEAQALYSGDGYHVATGAELAAAANAEAASNGNDLRETLLPFAAVALLVGMFVITNTFSMLVTQRTRQYALLRAVGAYRKQVRKSILIEALALGVLGGTVGVLAGIALGPLMIAVLKPGQQIDYTISPIAIGLGYLVALVVTTASAYTSAQRAAKVSPMAALRLDATVTKQSANRRNIAGLAALAVSVIAVLATVSPSADTTARIVGMVGAIIGAIGVLLLAPVLAGFLLRPLISLTRKFAGPATRLGVQNAARDSRRTAGTATAITVGLGLVCAFGTLSATLTSLIGSSDRANIPITTTILQPAAGKSASLDASDLDKVKALPGVTEAAATRDVIAHIDYAGGSSEFKVSAIDPSALGTVLTPQLTAGANDLHRGVVVSQNQADMMGLKIGDPLSVRLGRDTVIKTTVAGIYYATELQSSLYFDVAQAPSQLQDRLSMIYASGGNPAEVRQTVDSAFQDRPDVTVTDRDALVEADIAEQSLAFVVMYAMFGVAIIIAVFGVVNTLVLSVTERTREIGMTRALGASRRLVRRMITMESLVISLFGALLGVVVGVGVGAVMQHAMLGQALFSLSVPVDVIALALVGIVVAGVLAALWPAHRASRTDMLAAISGG